MKSIFKLLNMPKLLFDIFETKYHFHNKMDIHLRYYEIALLHFKKSQTGKFSYMLNARYGRNFRVFVYCHDQL